MEKRNISKETKIKILQCAAGILRMHGIIAGDRVCQDWSDKREQSPHDFFTKSELDDIRWNYEIYNSLGDDYIKGGDALYDEMVASFCIAYLLDDMACDGDLGDD